MASSMAAANGRSAAIVVVPDRVVARSEERCCPGLGRVFW